MLAHRDVAQAWADNRGHEDGNARGSRMYYTGPTIFSYGSHFAIAKFVQSKSGATAILLNPDKYSKSTSAHQNYVRQAIPGYCRIFNIDPQEQHKAFDVYMGRLTELKEKIATARQKKGDYIFEAESVHREMLRYNEFFECNWPIAEDTSFEATIARYIVENGRES